MCGRIAEKIVRGSVPKGLGDVNCKGPSLLSSFCHRLVKRNLSATNPILQMDRPPRQSMPPPVPSAAIMDALIEAARERGRPRDLAVFLLLRFTGMRRDSVATLRVGQLYGEWGLRGMRVKGGKVRDVPVPAPVMRFLQQYVTETRSPAPRMLTSGTPLF